MKIVVLGSLRDVPFHADLCEKFVSALGDLIAERNHTLLTGCHGSLDKTIAESANRRLEALHKDVRSLLVSYRLRDEEPVHRYGSVRVSSLADWDLTHPELTPPEQIGTADVAIVVAGGEGTFIAANWARICGIPVLGVAQFGGAGEAVYKWEQQHFQQKYSNSISREAFEVLSQDTPEFDRLAKDVVLLAERIVMPQTVFAVMPFTSDLRDVFGSYKDVCKEFGFEAVRADLMEEAETNERIMPRVFNGIRASAFVLAEVSALSANVFYEIGFAQGIRRQIIVTARKGTALPFDLSDVPVIFWDDQESLKEQLRQRIAKILAKIGRSVASSPRRTRT